MDVNNIDISNNVNIATTNNNAAVNNSAAANNNAAVANEANAAASTGDVKPNTEAAVFEPSKEAQAVYKPDMEKVKQIWAEHDVKVENFRRLVETLLNKQAQKFDLTRDIMGKVQWQGDEMIDIDEETRAAAKAEIEEGGYYSVEETAKRLLDFAVALSGGDPSKVGILREAVDKGFKAAEEMWGGELPEISKQTYDAVMKGFDEWEKAGNSNAITLLNPAAPAVTNAKTE